MSDMTKLLVVLGATGIQGGSVVATYLNRPEWKIRAITRDPSKPAAKKLEEQGVEVVAADLDDVESLSAAFKGANMIFAVTDFWAPFFLPTTPSKFGPSQTINEYCYALELQQGKNIALAASRSLSSLNLLIWSSLVDSKKWSKGKYTWNYHFDSKAHVYDHIVEKYPELAGKTSQLFMGSYMSNFQNKALAPSRAPDGTLVLRMPHNSAILEPYVDPVNDTGRFVEALETLGGGQKLFGVSDMRNCGEYMRLWGEFVGGRGRIEEVSMEEYIREVSKEHEGFAREVADSRGFNADFGWLGREKDVLMPKDLGIKTTTIEEFIQRTDWSPMVRGLKERL